MSDARVRAQRRWESLLHFMVATDSDASARPEAGWKMSKEVKDELLAPSANGWSLMQRENLSSRITQAGFQFLLRPLRAQVWQLVMHIVHRRRAKEHKKADLWLATVFQVSFCTLGAGYSKDKLSKTQQVASSLKGCPSSLSPPPRFHLRPPYAPLLFVRGTRLARACCGPEWAAAALLLYARRLLCWPRLPPWSSAHRSLHEIQVARLTCNES